MGIKILDIDFVEADKLLRDPLGVLSIRLRQVVAEAIAAERERCGQIAEAVDSGRGNEKEIARAIRLTDIKPSQEIET